MEDRSPGCSQEQHLVALESHEVHLVLEILVVVAADAGSEAVEDLGGSRMLAGNAVADKEVADALVGLEEVWQTAYTLVIILSLAAA